MKNVNGIRSLICLAIALSTTTFASDSDARPRNNESHVGWCSIQARVRMNSYFNFWYITEGKGFGRIVCDYDDGRSEIIPIKVMTKSKGIAVSTRSRTSYNVSIHASGFAVTGGGAQALLGTYGMIRTGAQFLTVGGDIGLGMTANRRSERFNVSIPLVFQAKRGVALTVSAEEVGMRIAFDPQNTQARYTRELPVRRPVVRNQPAPRAPRTIPAPPPAAPADGSSTVEIDENGPVPPAPGDQVQSQGAPQLPPTAPATPADPPQQGNLLVDEIDG